MPPPVPQPSWEHVLKQVARVREETGRVIVGQNAVVEQMLTALLCRGHCLLVGVPGLAKTLLVSTLGKILGLKFQRIQFTPDLMPTDILGSEVLQETPGGGRSFNFVPGPIFANLILADEINRTPPKTQAALLEAMQEKQVTVAGKTRALEEPFLVFATQNPIEHEGTYPLPEAQLDRFFFDIRLDYPTLAEEAEVLARTTGKTSATVEAVLDATSLMALQEAVLEVPVPDHVTQAILQLTHRSRPGGELADDFIKNYVAWGAGPRASQSLVRAARALALLRGQAAASIEEVKAVAAPVLRHRILPNYNATGDNITVEQIITHLLGKI
ncbi:MAG: MoxR family ATPase [Prosthecobacter sp.]|uniref:AAA family ATPase n=1 Tax=Prosthecobacter sp. TaxID=1965333 RepID=UPI0025F18E8C|nr:MoxR family ATPase [Prosthecobacter sp.]MCF7784926.1 MoxR family ATPase [Prosthecobacter sp.]